MRLSDPTWLLIIAVPMRVVVDLLWWVQSPVGTLGQLVSGAMVLALTGLAMVHWRRLSGHPMRWQALALVGVTFVGLLRSDDPASGISWAAHLLTPVAWLAAWWVVPSRPSTLVVWTGALAVPVALGLGALAMGQPADHVLHGWPRLLGAYGNVHTHAGVMAVGGVCAAAIGVKGPEWVRVVAMGAAVCLLATFVRTAWLWAVVAAVGTVWAHPETNRRTRVAALVLATAGCVLGVLSGRLVDLGALLAGTPPPGGWSQLGSSRVAIWQGTLRAFLDGSDLDFVLGRGLGDHQGLFRHFDPHSDWLSVLVQLGVVGACLWGWWMARGLQVAWQAARRSHDVTAALAFGLLLGAFVTAPLSNDWISRATVVLWTWGCLGCSIRPPEQGREPAP